VSFMLSFSCVIGIAFFFPMARNLLKKWGICNKVTESFALSLIVNLSVSFVMLYYFGKINPIGILTNIFVLPLFSLVFRAVFVVLMLSLVLPFCAKLLVLLNLPIDTINLFVAFVSTVGRDISSLKISFVTVVLFMTLISFCSKFFLKNNWVKLGCVFAVFVLLVVQIYLNNFVVAI